MAIHYFRPKSTSKATASLLLVQTLEAGELILLDMGAEFHCYASDITCTYPVNGKWRTEQKAVYDVSSFSEKGAGYASPHVRIFEIFWTECRKGCSSTAAAQGFSSNASSSEGRTLRCTRLSVLFRCMQNEMCPRGI